MIARQTATFISSAILILVNHQHFFLTTFPLVISWQLHHLLSAIANSKNQLLGLFFLSAHYVCVI